MELIQSFSVDHTLIVPGIFISRVDKVGGGTICFVIVLTSRDGTERLNRLKFVHTQFFASVIKTH